MDAIDCNCYSYSLKWLVALYMHTSRLLYDIPKLQYMLLFMWYKIPVTCASYKGMQFRFSTISWILWTILQKQSLDCIIIYLYNGQSCEAIIILVKLKSIVGIDLLINSVQHTTDPCNIVLYRTKKKNYRYYKFQFIALWIFT